MIHFVAYSVMTVAFAAVAFVLSGVRFIKNDRIGIVEKRWSPRGSIRSGFIALNGESGFQPEILRGGVHWLMPWQYRVHIASLVTIPQGKIGYVIARDGRSLEQNQTLASNSKALDFQDVRDFIANGGQKGPQRRILREGTYAINLAQFSVICDTLVWTLPLNQTSESASLQATFEAIKQRQGFVPVVITGTQDSLGIVTVHDGKSLDAGDIIAPIVAVKDGRSHDNFQDPESFIALGGQRGRQLEVLVDGTYYINRLFATVELVPKTVVEVGYAGVVVSYTGSKGEDLSGDDYKHGELVANGSRGVWSEPLMPGKYPFNVYAGKIIMVPTTNFVLKWIQEESGSHSFDENLSEVSLITKDAFEPNLPLSVVVHIDYKKAPLVIQRFGDVKRLVEQTLDPMVSAYFKNIGQIRTLIQLLQDRSKIQDESHQAMKERFGMYNLELQEVLIGTPKSPAGDTKIEDILTQLRSRQIANEQVETYSQQEKAAVKERELNETRAKAAKQVELTASEISIQVQENQGKADFQRSVQKALEVKTLAEASGEQVRLMAVANSEQVRLMGRAEAEKIKMLADADAERISKTGSAEAATVEKKVKAYGGAQIQMTQQVMGRFAEAVEKGHVPLVPQIVMGQGSDGKGSGVIESLMAMLLSDKIGNGSSKN